MIPLEICLDADTRQLADNLEYVHRIGVDRVELCADMHQEGLTPSSRSIMLARDRFSRGELLIMVRPRAGNFCYAARECEDMASSIDMAASLGADGVVFGVLDEHQSLQREATAKLVNLARQQGLSVTFHRAFDAIVNPLKSVLPLMDMGVNRILSSGTPWESGLGAESGLPLLKEILSVTQHHAEVVVGGGVSPDNASAIISSLSDHINGATDDSHVEFSLHCYSSVLNNGAIDHKKLSRLFNSCLGNINEVK